MFELRRTPYLALIYGVLIGSAVIWLVEAPGRPLTLLQAALFYALSCLPGLGLALLGDPAAQKAKAAYLKVDFYAPKHADDAGGADGRHGDRAPRATAHDGGRL